MKALNHHELAQLLADAQEQITHTVEIEHIKRGGYLSILPGTPFEDASTEDPDIHCLAVIHDLRGLGPAGFDEATLERLADRATCFAVLSVAADPSLYSIFGDTAAVLGRVLVVETTLPLYAAWRRFLLARSPHVPLLPYLLEGRGQ